MSNSARPPLSAGPPPASGGSGAPASTTCMLLVGDRVVLRADAPPEAEYILFEIADIELRSSEPGRVREHGYQTTVERARARLAHAGVTAALAHELAAAMQPVLTTAYARGPAARQVARYLGALELFQADRYDSRIHAYRGVFLDLPGLVADLALPAGGVALQALYIAMLLEREDDETTVFLSTDAWTRARKPGERTHRRPNLGAVRELGAALSQLASQDPQPVVAEQLPRADVIAFLRERAESAPDDDARALYTSLQRAVDVRDIPERGPLAEPALWVIETRLEIGDFEGIVDAIEEAEQTYGRTPGTTYLRARASLALRLEPAKLIAERVSALALSMTSFEELSLLAAEAWLEAGDPRRAMPYARDLVDAASVDEGLLLRAKRLLAQAVGAAPDKHKTYADSIPASALPPSQPPPPVARSERPPPPPVTAPDPHVSRSFAPAPSRVPTERERPAVQPPPLPFSPLPPPQAPPRKRSPDPLSVPPPPPPRAVSRKPPPSPRAPRTPQTLPAARAPVAARTVEIEPPTLEPPSPPPPAVEIDLAPPPRHGASFTLDLPGPDAPPLASAPPSASAPPEARPATASQQRRRQSMGVVQMESRAPPSFDPRAEPDGDDPPWSSPARSSPPRSSGGRYNPAIANKETFRGAHDGGRPSRAPSYGPPSDDLDPHGRPTPLRPPSAGPSPLPPRSGASARPPSGRPSMPTPMLDADLPPSSTEAVARAVEREKSIKRRSDSGRVPSPAVEMAMHGASLPPYRLESPPPLLAKAPLLPRLDGAGNELAEHLQLPAGLSGGEARPFTLPKSVLEARVAFTLLARELGQEYREVRGTELRADVSGVEAMQAVLLESFPGHAIHTSEDARELRRHGALLSEILARRLGAAWIDISPSELGYWAMIVPPDTRVWPFGRVARLVEMGHRERDLVSYFFELQGRARGH